MSEIHYFMGRNMDRILTMYHGMMRGELPAPFPGAPVGKIKGLPEDREERENVCRFGAITSIKAAEQMLEDPEQGNVVEMSWEDLYISDNILRIYLAWEKMEEEGIAKIRWDLPDEYGLPTLKIIDGGKLHRIVKALQG